MAWQDELIELETKLASGALSAEEYRRARDELFAQSQTSSAAADPPEQPAQQQPAQQPGTAAGAGTGTGAVQPTGQQPAPEAPQAPEPQQPQAPAPQAQQPQQPPAQQPQQQQPAPGQPGGPFPPPFQWGQGGGPAGGNEAPDSTQVIRPVESQPQGGPGERTQVVRDDPDRTQTVSDPERTQTVSGVGQQGARQRPPQHQQPRQNQGWTDDDSPPWAGSDATPVIAPNTTWTKQGPEAFDGGSGGGKRGRLVGTVVAGVLVVALAVVAVIYFTNTGGNNPGSTPQGQAPAAGGGNLPEPTTSSPPPLPDPPQEKSEPKSVAAALTKVPGQLRPGGGPVSKSKLASSTFFDSKILDAFKEAGFTGGLFKATTQNGSDIGVFAMTVRDAEAATQAAQAYGSVQTDGGIPARREDSMRGVAAFGTPDDSSDETQVRRAVYVLYKRVIIIDVGGSDKAQVDQTFKSLLDKQVDFAPPTEREAIP